jgi:hypothetical protein
MTTAQLYLDEDVWLGLANAGRTQGFDLVHAYEAKRGGLSDTEQLAYATEHGRAILTHNAKDFVPLALDYFYNQRKHCGIILSPQLSKGELVRRTLNLLQSLSSEEIANTVRHLANYK